MGPAQQVAGLRILVGLLSHSDNNKAQFRKLHGFCILYYLLCRFELSMETYPCNTSFVIMLVDDNNLSSSYVFAESHVTELYLFTIYKTFGISFDST
jgi:hypothetical protein